MRYLGANCKDDCSAPHVFLEVIYKLQPTKFFEGKRNYQAVTARFLNLPRLTTLDQRFSRSTHLQFQLGQRRLLRYLRDARCRHPRSIAIILSCLVRNDSSELAEEYVTS
jgi:hypothetical protein